MSRKLTITVSDEVYQGLHTKVGRRRISQFIDRLARPHVLSDDIETAYKQMSEDQDREREALSWSEGVIADVAGCDPNVAR